MVYSKLLTFLVFYLHVFMVTLKQKMKTITTVISAVVSSLIFGKQADAIVISTSKRQELFIPLSAKNLNHMQLIRNGVTRTRSKKQVTELAICNLNSIFSVKRMWQVP